MNIEKATNEELNKLAHAILTDNCEHQKDKSKWLAVSRKCECGTVFLEYEPSIWSATIPNYSTNIADTKLLLDWVSVNKPQKSFRLHSLNSRHTAEFTYLGAGRTSSADTLERAVTQCFVLAFGKGE